MIRGPYSSQLTIIMEELIIIINIIIGFEVSVIKKHWIFINTVIFKPPDYYCSEYYCITIIKSISDRDSLAS